MAESDLDAGLDILQTLAAAQAVRGREFEIKHHEPPATYRVMVWEDGGVAWRRRQVSGARVIWRTIPEGQVPDAVKLELRLMMGGA